MKKIIYITIFMVYISIISAAIMENEEYKFIVIEDGWGGAITDDGTNTFIVKQSTIGIFTSEDGKTFQVFPPFLNYIQQGTEGQTGSGSGDDVSGGGEQTIRDPKLGVFMASKPGYPNVECTIHLENYDNINRRYEYITFLADNALERTNKTDRVGFGISPSNSITETFELSAPQVGEYWCKVIVFNEQGQKVLEVAQRVQSKKTFNLSDWVTSQDWTLWAFFIGILLLLIILVIWAIIYTRQKKSNK